MFYISRVKLIIFMPLQKVIPVSVIYFILLLTKQYQILCFFLFNLRVVAYTLKQAIDLLIAYRSVLKPCYTILFSMHFTFFSLLFISYVCDSKTRINSSDFKITIFDSNFLRYYQMVSQLLRRNLFYEYQIGVDEIA